MKNTIYTVKAGNGISKLNKLEISVYEFFTNTEFLSVVQVGDSYSEKKLKTQFAKWNNDKMTVSLNSLVNEKNCKTVCKFFASQVKDGMLKSSVIPVLHENKAHGNFSIDFVDSSTLEKEYTDKELKPIEKKTVDPTEFIITYMNKHREEIHIEDIQNAIDLLK